MRKTKDASQSFLIHLKYILLHISGVPKKVGAPEVVSVSGGSCQLKWFEPDNGDSIIIGYSLETCRENGYINS